MDETAALQRLADAKAKVPKDFLARFDALQKKLDAFLTEGGTEDDIAAVILTKWEIAFIQVTLADIDPRRLG